MITFIDDHTIRLEPDPPRRLTRKPPAKKLNALEREITTSFKSAVVKQVRAQLWFERQLKKADDYQRALAERAILKTTGLPGYQCAPYCKIMLTPEQMRGGGRWD